MTTKPPVPVEDLVKTAIKEALAKRKGVELAESHTTEAAKVYEEELKVVLPTVKKDLKEGQVWASTLFPKLGYLTEDDFGVNVFKNTDFNEAVAVFIPKINPVYKLRKEQVTNILKGWELGDKTLMYGPTGSGKSSIIEQLCAYTGRPFIRVNCSGDMDSSMIFGQQVVEDGATVWKDGVVTEAVKHGAVFAWDEWDVTPSEISMGLQWLLEDEGKLFLKEMPGTATEKFITPDPRFLIVAIGNTQGQGDHTGLHSGTNVQNSATVDRFETVVKVDYMEPEDEIAMLSLKYPVVKAKEKLVKLANLVRQGFKEKQIALTMSPRSTLGICKKVSFGYTLQQSIQLVYLNKLVESDQKVVEALMTKIYGSPFTE